MKILVTGGAGYIGSQTVYELINNGYDVVVVDNLSTGNAQAIHEKALFYEGDQSDIKLLDKVFNENKIEAVIHCSAKLIVPESVTKPIEYFENNVHGLAVLLKSMKEHDVKNIVFSSTAAVYGEPQNVPIKEDDPKEPFTPYGESKRACEWLIKSSSKAYGMNFVIFRYFNVAGADSSLKIGQATKGKELTHLIPVVIEAVLGIRPKMLVYGTDYNTLDGTCVRDYIHVSDLARAHVCGVEYVFKRKSGIFNLGSQTGYSVKEVIAVAEKVTGKKIPVEYAPRREGDPSTLTASVEKARKELQFENKFTLEDMIKSDWLWRKDRKF